MAAYNLFLKEVPVNEWTAEGGTAIAVLGRETLEPSNPSVALKDKSPAVNKKVEATFTIPAALATELGEGAKIIAATLHFNIKGSGASKQVKLSTNSPAASSEPTVTSSQAWYKLELTKAQAEELTKAKLEELVLLCDGCSAPRGTTSSTSALKRKKADLTRSTRPSRARRRW